MSISCDLLLVSKYRIPMAKNGKGQRLGDLVAGTAVIRAKVKQSINITILKEVAQDYTPKYPQVIKLSDNDARIIKETLENARKTNDVKLVRKLVQKLESIMGVQHEGDHGKWVDGVLKDFNYYTQNM